MVVPTSKMVGPVDISGQYTAIESCDLPCFRVRLLFIRCLLRGLFEYFRVHSRVNFDLLILDYAGFFSILLVLALERYGQPIDRLPVIHGGFSLGWAVSS